MTITTKIQDAQKIQVKKAAREFSLNINSAKNDYCMPIHYKLPVFPNTDATHLPKCLLCFSQIIWSYDQALVFDGQQWDVHIH